MKNAKTNENMEVIQNELNEDRFKYFLNDDATLVKLKGHATRAPIEQTPTNDPTHTFQFSSGSFVAVMNPLVNFWKSAQGKTIKPEETDNLDTSVKSVKAQKDAGGKITGHITKLSVEGEDVTITTFDTQVKVRVQGGKMQVEYTKRALLPYLETNIKTNSAKIKDINTYFIDYPGPNSKSKINATHVKVHCHFCKKEFRSRMDIRTHMSTVHNTRSPPKLFSMFNSEQQLEPLSEDTNVLDTSISSNDSLPLEELPLPELTSPSEPPSPSETPVQPPSPFETPSGPPSPSEPPLPPSQREKISILPEDSFCKEVNTSAPPPPMLWSGRLPVLPASWRSKGGSLPSESLGAILEAIAKVSNVNVPQPQTSVLLSNLDLGSSDGTSHLDNFVAQQELLSSLNAGSRDLYLPGEQGGSPPLSASPTAGQSVNMEISADTADSTSGQDHLAPNPSPEEIKRTSSTDTLKPLKDFRLKQKNQEDCLGCQMQQVHECFQEHENVETSSLEPRVLLAPTHQPDKQDRASVIKLAPPQEPAWEGMGPKPPTFLRAPLSHHRQGSHKWDNIVVKVTNEAVQADEPKQSTKKIKTAEKETPGLGKKRLNPTPPSQANFAACNKDDPPQPEEPESPYGSHECEACGEKFKWAGSVYKHMANVHGLPIPCDSSDPLLYFLAEQNEEVNQKLSETNEMLNILKEQVAQILNTIIPVKCEMCSYTAPTASILNTHKKVKHVNQEKTARLQPSPNPQPKIPKPRVPQPGAGQAGAPQPSALGSANPQAKRPPPLFPPSHPQAQHYPSPPPGGAQFQGQIHTGKRPRGKLQHLHITDSIGRNMLYPELESKTGSLILPRRATPSVYDDRAFKPGENVQAVLQRELISGKKFHTVIFGAPSVDITNQDVQNGVFEQNTVESVASAHNMVDAATYALDSGQVEQVILMEHAPRYDTPQQDPYEAKPYLARLANETLRRAVGQSRHRDKIMVGSLAGLQVDGKSRSDMMTNNGDNWRSRNVKVGKYDGVHYYSKQGQQALTCSMMEVLREAGLARSPKPSPPSYPQSLSQDQWQTVGRGNRGAVPTPTPFQIPLSNRFQGNW